MLRAVHSCCPRWVTASRGAVYDERSVLFSRTQRASDRHIARLPSASIPNSAYLIFPSWTMMESRVLRKSETWACGRARMLQSRDIMGVDTVQLATGRATNGNCRRVSGTFWALDESRRFLERQDRGPEGILQQGWKGAPKCQACVVLASSVLVASVLPPASLALS